MDPTEFDSFVGGFDLTAANYSGGAGGTFSNLISGYDAWTVDSATPSFSTEESLSGMDFTGSSTESIRGPMPALYEGTVIAVAKPTGTGIMYSVGGSSTSHTTWGQFFNSGDDVEAYNTSQRSGAADFTNDTVNVFTTCWSPFAGQNMAQVNLGTPAIGTNADGTKTAIDYAEAFIGQGRFSTTQYYFDGWIARVLFFSRSLYHRESTNLTSLITSEIARL